MAAQPLKLHWVRLAALRRAVPSGAVVCTTFCDRRGSDCDSVDLSCRSTLGSIILWKARACSRADATGLLALEFSVALVVSGTVPSESRSRHPLQLLTYGGWGRGCTRLLVGWVVAHDSATVCKASALQTDGLSRYTILCLSAGRGHACLGRAGYRDACGLYSVGLAGLDDAVHFRGASSTRYFGLEHNRNFILNGFVFILIGLQLQQCCRECGRSTGHVMLGAAMFLSLLLMRAVRMMMRVLHETMLRFIGKLIRRRVLQAEHGSSFSGRQAIVLRLRERSARRADAGCRSVAAG